MLTAARVREYTGESGVLAMFRDLGYPIAPVDVDCATVHRVCHLNVFVACPRRRGDGRCAWGLKFGSVNACRRY